MSEGNEAGPYVGAAPVPVRDPGPGDRRGRRLLIVDPDAAFGTRLAEALRGLGFDARASDAPTAARAALADPPPYVVVDICAGPGAGLDFVAEFAKRRPDGRVVVLTGHGAVATAVAAMKLGAADYLTKPADPDAVAQALLAAPGTLPEPPAHPISPDRARWEHVYRVFELTGRNVSETARRLGMHRRTLQRMLSKNAPR